MRYRITLGFTLIELLVVIAIIAIRASILFPVFAWARETARAASCLSKNKQYALATLMYMDDYDEVFPMSSNLAGTCIETTYLALQPYAKNTGITQCPSAPQALNVAAAFAAYGGACAGTPTYISYSVNGVLFAHGFVSPVPVVTPAQVDRPT